MDLKNLWPKKDAPQIEKALKFVEKYKLKKIVLKYGGQVMANDQLSKAFAQDAAICNLIGIKSLVIHGGGPQIKKRLEKQNIKSKFILGLRVTDENVIKIVEDVLLNDINPDLVRTINSFNAIAEPITARNKNGILKVTKAKNPDLGFVADPEEIDVDKLNNIIKLNKVPVIAPMGLGDKNQVFNINADTAAGIIAIKIKATRLLLMTDVPGVKDQNGKYISKLTVSEAQTLIDNETITGGMIPKIQTCISAIKNGVGGVVIIDGTRPHAVLHELFTDEGAGTLITK
ncbi:MAG: acetylglutamate kinase [Candidatus Pelagibacter sp.]|nr:acetylglutamate kinase [Candidatus Pelagibacter sp.]OUV86719.1 MAG: acetylglutamate kinase [Pelagibacteraceae bacterium TMED136]|tara:strand:- start:46116 stop:46976 length:861 start_codon:yes stop_codon:yes gene_type:complete